MPELPDVEVYVEALRRRIQGRRLDGLRFASPFVLRTVAPAPERLRGNAVVSVRRLGKRIVIEVEGDRFAVIHLMVAGRLKWEAPGAKLTSKIALAALDFDTGTLVLTEAGSRKRASIHLVEGEAALNALDPGGLEPLALSREAFETRLRSENHTIKRSLTDPRLFAGIGNAYSDEILHRARLSPMKLTTKLSADEVDRAFEATREVLVEWLERLRRETGDGFPAKVTAFRKEMAVHGRFEKPCPVCGTPVQRIVYADNETNYCPRCQTEGRLLADRAVSRLLHEDWPRSIDELG